MASTIELGTRIRVLYPDYAAGYEGVVKAREEKGRWIVKLERNSLEESKEPWLLSLDESDFEVLESSLSENLKEGKIQPD